MRATKERNEKGKVIFVDNKPVIPAVAEKAGYSRLVFCDDFDDASTIDWEATGQEGFHWYLNRPFGWPTCYRNDLTLEDSVLTVANKDCCAQWAIATVDAKSNQGQAFRYGYFEARIRFDVNKNQKDVSGFPAWWSFSRAHTTGDNKDTHWTELDFMEAMTNSGANGDYTGTYVATAHDHWRRPDWSICNCQNPNCWNDGVITEGWHNYGCLWMPGVYEWYYDGKCISRLTYSADHIPEPFGGNNFPSCYSYMDKEDMLLILGSCAEWPMEVDWVRVWQE